MLKNSLLQQSNTGFDPKVSGVYFQGSPVKFFPSSIRVPTSPSSLFLLTLLSLVFILTASPNSEVLF